MYKSHLLAGYPGIVPDDAVCRRRLPLAVGDYAYASLLGRRLNAELRAAAHAAGATYVDVAAASAGHDVCSADPWVNGSRTTEDAQAYHPLASEQRAVARLVLDQLG